MLENYQHILLEAEEEEDFLVQEIIENTLDYALYLHKNGAHCSHPEMFKSSLTVVAHVKYYLSINYKNDPVPLVTLKKNTL